MPEETYDAVIAGAGDGTRTRDNLLGRQGLYQLSYSRKFVPVPVWAETVR